MAVFFATPAVILIPRFWESTEESHRSSWHERRVQQRLEIEMGIRELEPRVDLDPERRLPRRW